MKTTGSKGLHVVSPLDGAASFHEVGALCTAIAGVLCARHPTLMTTEFYKKDRKGRIYLDIARNSYGATVVAPYSLRGRPGAPVSAPIEWSELEAIRPDAIRIGDVRARLDRIGDLWSTLRSQLGSVSAAAKALLELAPTGRTTA